MTTSSARLIAALLLGLLVLFFIAPALSDDTDPVEQAIAAAGEQRYAEALELVTPLAKEGNPRAQNVLGVLYAQGWGVEQDFDKAREWYEKAAAGGNPRAYFNLAHMYATGTGVEKDCDKALEYWHTPAEQGDPIAQVNLGSLYMEGFDCIPQDIDEGIRWYRLAAEQDDPLAQHSMGAFYALGQGVKQDYELALEWYRKAAAQGNSDSQASIGWMYFAGEGVEPDIDKAREWYEKAAAQGNEGAIQALRSLDAMEKGPSDEYVEELVEMYLAAPAREVAGESIWLSNLSMVLDLGFNVVLGDLQINASNRELIRAEVAAKREAIMRAIEVRGVADIAGTYTVEATSACSKIQSAWADGTQQGLLGNPTFTQAAHEVMMTQLADFNGKEPLETPAIIVEDALVFVDMMNTEFYFFGTVEGEIITMKPDADQVLAVWPDWVQAPAREDLEKCKITLTRQKETA